MTNEAVGIISIAVALILAIYVTKKYTKKNRKSLLDRLKKKPKESAD